MHEFNAKLKKKTKKNEALRDVTAPPPKQKKSKIDKCFQNLKMGAWEVSKGLEQYTPLKIINKSIFIIQ